MQCVDRDVRDLPFLEIGVHEHQIELLDDVLGIDRVVGAGNKKVPLDAELVHRFHLLVGHAVSLADVGKQLRDILVEFEQVEGRAVFGEAGQYFRADLVILFGNVVRNGGFYGGHGRSHRRVAVGHGVGRTILPVIYRTVSYPFPQPRPQRA